MVNHGRRGRKSQGSVNIASWNVRSLVEDSGGDPRICRKRPLSNSCSHVIDRKFDFLVTELRRFRVDIAAVQETRWFDNDVWLSQGYTMLHSGRQLPADNELASRNESVGIILSPVMTDAWRRAGQVWTPVSSRIIVTRLKVQEAGMEMPGREWKRRSDVFMSVINVYAPTSKASLSTINQFYGDLQRCLSNIPKNDVIIVLGDFNARVGVGTGSADDVWQDVRGRLGVGNCNAAGERLLMWCATNQLSIMNTWFQKPDFRRGTWKHPATKQYHMIDFVLMHRHQMLP